MKILLLAATVALSFACNARVDVIRIEWDRDTDVTWLVGVDGESRPVKIVNLEEYALLTGRVDAVWHSLNSTESGRRGLHGKVKEQTIGDDGVKHITYEDGYRYDEKPVKTTGIVRDSVRGIKGVRTAAPAVLVRPKCISDRQWEFRKKVNSSSSVIKEVTVEHDAGTGKDKVVK